MILLSFTSPGGEGTTKFNLFPNSGSYRVLVVFQRTGEFQESPQDFSAAGTGQAMMPPKPPEDENWPHYISSIGRVAGRRAEVV